MDYARKALADRLAAEYAAGTLRGGARRRFERLLVSHTTLADAVRAWEERLMPLTVSVAPVLPPAHVWLRIQARLGHGEPAAKRRVPVAFWRSLSVIASGIAVTLAVLLAVPEPVQPPVIVVLERAADAPRSPGDATSPFIASLSADGRALVTRPVAAVAVSPDRALELWAMPPEGAPRSLGLVSAETATVRREGLPRGTVALAVSLEPAGGSPTGAPTGPVLYVGKLPS